MIFVLLIILIAVILLTIKIDKNTMSDIIEDVCMGVATLACICTVLLSIVLFIAIIKVSNSVVIDEKIAMYEEENRRIEASITAVVENYQQYETDIFKDVSESHSESSMILVTMYPELKSDALVQEQITIYTANNEKIKQLKEERINASIWRWWLYFGH